MKLLVKYEFLKIVRRKSTFIVMLISVLVTAFLFGLPILQFQTYDHDRIIKGISGIAYEKKQFKDLSVPLTDDYIAETISEYQQLFKIPENVGYDGSEQFLIGDAYWNFVAPREKLLQMIAANYDRPDETSGFQKLPDLDMTNGMHFYQTREEKIKTILNTPSRELSDKQKDYWSSMSSSLDTPLQYGYYEGWEIIISSFELLMFALLSVCIVLAPVFSGEYQAGTDTVILSAKYGKTKLITAKILSALLFGLLAFTLHIIPALGLPLAAFGIDGFNLPIQIGNTSIPYPFTFLQAVLVNLGVMYLVLLAMISLTLLLSAKMKSPFLVLIVIVPVLFIPMFLTPSGTAGAYNLTLFLLPYRSAMPEMGKYITYEFGSLVLNAFSARAILYAALTVILLPFTRLAFQKHQVSV